MKTKKTRHSLCTSGNTDSFWSVGVFQRRCELFTQILRNNSREVPSNWPIIFVQTPTTTQPEEIRGKHGQEPQHNPAFLQKFLWEGWPKGNCTTVAEWSMFLFFQKITTSIRSCLQNFLIFCFNLFLFLLVIWLTSS